MFSHNIDCRAINSILMMKSHPIYNVAMVTIWNKKIRAFHQNGENSSLIYNTLALYCDPFSSFRIIIVLL